MKRILIALAAVLLLHSFSTTAFSQVGFFAIVTGTVNDSSGHYFPESRSKQLQ